MDKPTEGPWEVESHANGCVFITSDEVGHGDIADLYHRRPDGEIVTKKNAVANAHLISAAPDMREALKDMLAGWKYIRQHHGDLYGVGWDRAEQKAIAALAKADGASS